MACLFYDLKIVTKPTRVIATANDQQIFFSKCKQLYFRTAFIQRKYSFIRTQDLSIEKYLKFGFNLKVANNREQLLIAWVW